MTLTIKLIKEGVKEIELTPNVKLHESLRKQLHIGHTGKNPLPIVQDHLRNTHRFQIIWEPVTDDTSTCFAKRRELIALAQNTGGIFKLTIEDTDIGLSETYYGAIETIDLDINAGEPNSIPVVINFVESRNTEV